MKRLLVHAYAMNPADCARLAAFIELVALTGGHVFAMTESLAECHILVFDPANAQGAKLLQQLPPFPCIAYTNNAQVKPQTRLWVQANPVQLFPLRNTLIAIIAQVESLKAVPTEAFSPEALSRLERWLGILDTVWQGQVPQTIRGILGFEFVVLTATRQIMVRAQKSPAAWVQAILSRGNVITCSPQPTTDQNLGQLTVSLDRFRWELAKSLSDEMLLPNIAYMRSFSLSRWPDFGALGGTQAELRLSALLMGRAATVGQIRSITGFEQAAVIGFLNGCSLLGCLRGVRAHLGSALEASNLQPPALTKQPKHIATIPRPSANAGPQKGSFFDILKKLRDALSFSKAS